MQSDVIGFHIDVTLREKPETPPANLSPDATTHLGEHLLPPPHSTRLARYSPELTGEA